MQSIEELSHNKDFNDFSSFSSSIQESRNKYHESLESNHKADKSNGFSESEEKSAKQGFRSKYPISIKLDEIVDRGSVGKASIKSPKLTSIKSQDNLQFGSTADKNTTIESKIQCKYRY